MPREGLPEMHMFLHDPSRILPSRFARLLFALVLACAMLVVPSATSTPLISAAPEAPRTPLRSMLRADGTLDLSTGWSGSLDPAGWTMTTDANGAPRFVRASGVSSTMVGRTTLAAPGDDKWDDRFGLSGTYSSVYAIAVNEQDVYVGGYFTSVGGVPANYIAKWNGRSWSAMGAGVSGTVYALAVSGNVVYAGGDFATAGTATVNSLAMWNGATWQGVGGGVWSGTYRATVRALALANGTLFVGGNFNRVGNVTAYGIAKWRNGWSALARGVGNYYTYDNSISGGTVNTIAVAYPKVYVGGYFKHAIRGTAAVEANSLAVWNDTSLTWAALGRGVGTTYDNGVSISYGTVNAIAINGADVVVGGDFAYAANAKGGVNVNSIAKWRNGWTALGNGVTTNYGRGTVKALAVYGTKLIIGGNFTAAGGTTMSHVAQWGNNVWSTMKGGTGGELYALAASGNGTYAGGYFSTAGTSKLNNIARWTGATWMSLGEGISQGSCCGYVNAVAIDPVGNVYVGGYFSSAGSLVTNNIAMWNGTSWSALGAGITGGYSSQVNAIAVSGNYVFVGGSFSTAGTTSANNVAVWNRSRKTWSRLGAGVNGPVYAFAVNGAQLFVGGQFTGAGTTDAENIARWNGTAWSKLGNGLNFGDGSVRALALYGAGRYVYIGGNFTYFNVNGGYAYANALLMWDSTKPNNWYLPGQGVTYRCGSSDCAGDVNALAIIGSDLFVGGDFDKAGKDNAATPYQDVVVAHGIVRLNLPSNRWYSLGGDVVGGGEQTIHSLAAAGKELYVGGNFATVANRTAHSIAKWSTATSSWTTLGSGMTSDWNGYEADVNALAASGAGVFVGGDFIKSGDKAASNFAKWGTAPNVALNPGFEQADATGWATGWSKATGATRVASPRRSGAASLKQSATNNSSVVIGQSIANLSPGKSYTVSAWVSIPATADKFQWEVYVLWRNGTTNIGTPVVVKRVAAPTNGAWLQIANTLVAPAGTTNAVVRLSATNLNATIYVDDVVFSTETAAPATAAPATAAATGAATADGPGATASGDAEPVAPALSDQPIEQTLPRPKPERHLRPKQPTS